MAPTMDQQVSAMTDTTEATLARTFGWDTPEAKLYRDCPTAFWLAPGDDAAFGVSPDGPIMPAPAVAAEDGHVDGADTVDGMRGAVLGGVLSAGPIFTAVLALTFPNTGPDAWYAPFGRVMMSLLIAPVTILVGAVLALLPMLAGVLLLGIVGTTIDRLRAPATWAATGSVMGIAIAAMFDAGSSAGPALIATGAFCASIARRFVDWHAPEPG